MKHLLILFVFLASGAALATVTTNQQYQLNNRMGPVARSVGLGDLIKDAAQGATLANGKVLVGNSSGVAAAVTPSGDVTISNAGVTAIGAAKVLETMLAVPSGSALYAARIARAVWDPSGDATMRTVAAHGLGVTLPAKAIITRSFFHTKTSLVSASNNGTIAFHCEDADNIFAAADIDASSGVAGQIAEGVSDGTAANMKIVDAACEITATVATNAFTAGKIDLFVEYVIAE
jgi:hypothetical protein